MKDFIHGALVKAASTDGIENMLKGAGIGAGANVGIGAVQGDFDVVGNAFSGAALGGIGGAAMKYGANRYAGNLLKQADGIAEAGGKKVGMFTNPGESHALSFMGGDENTERFAKMAAAGAFDGKGYSAGAAASPVAGKGSEVVDTTPVSPKVTNNHPVQKRAPTQKTGESNDDFSKRKENFIQMQRNTPEAQQKIASRANNKPISVDTANKDKIELRNQDLAGIHERRAADNMESMKNFSRGLDIARKPLSILEVLSTFGSKG